MNLNFHYFSLRHHGIEDAAQQRSRKFKDKSSKILWNIRSTMQEKRKDRETEKRQESLAGYAFCALDADSIESKHL